MGSLKRKSDENPSGEPAQKQHKENGSEMVDSEPVTCIHDVSYPEGCASPTHSGPSSASDHSGPAKVFPFSLDPFQAESIKCLENGESVRVSADTSAGKTVVALYAIAMSLQNKQRVIYTFLIKALNNEKYREFKQEFSDVGFMTGDVMLEPNASCLVHIH